MLSAWRNLSFFPSIFFQQHGNLADLTHFCLFPDRFLDSLILSEISFNNLSDLTVLRRS